MLEKPAISDKKIMSYVQEAYGLLLSRITFLPLGADVDTAVYQLLTAADTSYFLKLRKGAFAETAVTLPKYLYDQGITQIIPPLPTVSGQLWGSLDPYKTILYPFIDGRNGYEIPLSDHHWQALGMALKKIHTTPIPPELLNHIRRETYSPLARETVTRFLDRLDYDVYEDPQAKELAAFMAQKQPEIRDLIGRADRLAQLLQNQSPPAIVCHSDLHAGNIFISKDDVLYIVDWDEPILAPKERDLMYIGGGLLASKRSPQAEETMFYAAYGSTQINTPALAYYRYERIIQDIYEYCKQLFLATDGGEDREQSLIYFKSNFLPDHTIDIAYRSDKTVFPYT